MRRLFLFAGGLLLWACSSSSTTDASIVPAADASTTGGSGDAGTTTGACLPSCFADALAPAIRDCATSGSCTTSVTETGVAICYANGVKIVTAIGTPTTTTIENASGTCVTIESTTSGSGATATFKDGSGKAIGTVTISDTSAPNVIQVACGSEAPVTVNLADPACSGTNLPGTSGGGTGGNCTQDTSCKP